MGLTAQLSNFTTLTPPEMSGRDSAAARERHKSMQQRAEDIIYTLNHTFTCLSITDFAIMPSLYAVTGGRIGHPLHHSHNHGDKHISAKSDSPEDLLMKLRQTQADRKSKPPIFSKLITKESSGPVNDAASHDGKNLSAFVERHNHTLLQRALHWMVGEAIGDVGGAAVTIGVQRLFPGFMEGMRSLIEPFAGGFFRRGATHAAHKWADKHGMDYNSDEVVNRAQELYDYEMRHLPQMGVWTVSSVLLHYGVMKKLENITVADFTKQKVVGAAITAGLVFGARALAPDKAHKWDETAGRHVVVPLTKKVGKLFGVEEHEVDAYHESQRRKDEAPKRWAERVKPAATEKESSIQAQRA
jgi:hypothetical protein